MNILHIFELLKPMLFTLHLSSPLPLPLHPFLSLHSTLTTISLVLLVIAFVVRNKVNQIFQSTSFMIIVSVQIFDQRQNDILLEASQGKL